MPLADSSSIRGGSTSVRERIRSPHISDGRPDAGSQRAYSLGWDRQTAGHNNPHLTQTLTTYISLTTNPSFYRGVGVRQGRTDVHGGQMSVDAHWPCRWRSTRGGRVARGGRVTSRWSSTDTRNRCRRTAVRRWCDRSCWSWNYAHHQTPPASWMQAASSALPQTDRATRYLGGKLVTGCTTV